MKRIFYITICLLAAGCTSKVQEAPVRSMDQAFKEITLNDGIDRNEAAYLGTNYFMCYISMCGATSEPVDRGDKWEIGTVVGIAAQPFVPIYVDKQNGTIICSKGPTITAPKDDNG